MRAAYLCAIALFFVGVSASAVEPDPGIAAVTRIEGVAADAAKFDLDEGSQTIIIKSREEAKKWFADEALRQLAGKVDFSKQFVLIFAWKGSGQDRMKVTIADSYPEQALFKTDPGRTRDLRRHVAIYALRSNVKWKAQ
ncbi:MAG TPA: hypothetical protein VGN57_06590 [Pirellulaceae bacterium]|jgi:streptogramin lyase|nr:hypothetical protein [Pirellulaceae bacterium]